MPLTGLIRIAMIGQKMERRRRHPKTAIPREDGPALVQEAICYFHHSLCKRGLETMLILCFAQRSIASTLADARPDVERALLQPEGDIAILEASGVMIARDLCVDVDHLDPPVSASLTPRLTKKTYMLLVNRTASDAMGLNSMCAIRHTITRSASVEITADSPSPGIGGPARSVLLRRLLVSTRLCWASLLASMSVVHIPRCTALSDSS